MFRVAALSALCLLGSIGAVVSHQEGSGLCSQVFMMHQYCTRGGSEVPTSTGGRHYLVGKAGPRGPPGPPGKPAEVDYSTINEKINTSINERLRELDQALAKISELEDLLTWYNASNGYFYKAFSEEISYEGAKTRCEAEGAILASAGPRNPDVRRDLVTLMKNSGSQVIWIGANDIAREGSWVWEDGVTSNEMDWSTSPRQPDNARGEEHCAHYTSSYGWKVNDVRCEANLGYLCEKSYNGL